MNKVFFTGRLTRDVTLSETPAGTPLATFSLAVQRPYPNANGEREADFFNCVAFRGCAENLAKYTEKGKRIYVGGHLQNRQDTDKEGKKRTVAEIIVNDVEFLEFGENSPQNQNDGAKIETKAVTKEENKQIILEQIDDSDELPF